MDAPLEKSHARPAEAVKRYLSPNAERLMVGYWLITLVLSVLFLRDWITAWNVPLTLARPELVIYLTLSFALSQLMYALVARHGGRAFHVGATAIFAIGNGIAETLAFALVYRLGEVVGTGLVGLFAPAWASVAGFVLGICLFIIYGGLIHALFWLPVLPPHLDDTPRSQRIRKLRPIAEIALVLGWSLCFWLSRDIWSVVFFHILVDIGLMIKVRPGIFGASREPA